MSHVAILEGFANFLDEKAEEVTKFACSDCLYEASLSTINFQARRASADLVEATDVVECPHCGGDMTWDKDEISTQFYEGLDTDKKAEETEMDESTAQFLSLDDLDPSASKLQEAAVGTVEANSEYIPPAGVDVEKFNKYLTFRK